MYVDIPVVRRLAGAMAFCVPAGVNRAPDRHHIDYETFRTPPWCPKGRFLYGTYIHTNFYSAKNRENESEALAQDD